MHCEYGFSAWPSVSRRGGAHLFGPVARRETWAHTEKPIPAGLIGWLKHLLGRDDGWVPGLLAIVDAFFAPVLQELQPGADTAVRASQRADLQVDGVLALARALGRPPREVAEEVVARAMELGLGELCEKRRGGWARFYQFDPVG